MDTDLVGDTSTALRLKEHGGDTGGSLFGWVKTPGVFRKACIRRIPSQLGAVVYVHSGERLLYNGHRLNSLSLWIVHTQVPWRLRVYVHILLQTFWYFHVLAVSIYSRNG